MSTTSDHVDARPIEHGLSLRQAVESVLLTTTKPMSAAKLVEPLRDAGFETDRKAIEGAIEELNAAYEQAGSVARVESVAGGFRLMTLPSAGAILAAVHGARSSSRLSRAALETLSIVAYRQPITRAEIESIRGVASGEVLRSLLERRMITVTGRAEELGRPMLYGTTSAFLEQFGLAKIGDLPAMEGAGA
ncbi:MAG: SMC-Scp complex subunit ScpB [Planctomycetota bacterium]